MRGLKPPPPTPEKAGWYHYHGRYSRFWDGKKWADWRTVDNLFMAYECDDFDYPTLKERIVERAHFCAEKEPEEWHYYDRYIGDGDEFYSTFTGGVRRGVLTQEQADELMSLVRPIIFPENKTD